MDTKWPFMLIAFGLTLALGLTIASLERTGVMNNWDEWLQKNFSNLNSLRNKNA